MTPKPSDAKSRHGGYESLPIDLWQEIGKLLKGEDLVRVQSLSRAHRHQHRLQMVADREAEILRGAPSQYPPNVIPFNTFRTPEDVANWIETNVPAKVAVGNEDPARIAHGLLEQIGDSSARDRGRGREWALLAFYPYYVNRVARAARVSRSRLIASLSRSLVETSRLLARQIHRALSLIAQRVAPGAKRTLQAMDQVMEDRNSAATMARYIIKNMFALAMFVEESAACAEVIDAAKRFNDILRIPDQYEGVSLATGVSLTTLFITNMIGDLAQGAMPACLRLMQAINSLAQTLTPSS